MLIFRKLLIIKEKKFFTSPLTNPLSRLYFCAVKKHDGAGYPDEVLKQVKQQQ